MESLHAHCLCALILISRWAEFILISQSFDTVNDNNVNFGHDTNEVHGWDCTVILTAVVEFVQFQAFKTGRCRLASDQSIKLTLCLEYRQKVCIKWHTVYGRGVV